MPDFTIPEGPEGRRDPCEKPITECSFVLDLGLSCGGPHDMEGGGASMSCGPPHARLKTCTNEHSVMGFCARFGGVQPVKEVRWIVK